MSWTPRVLKDGSDSVGALGALNRVYLNIGLFSEEWLLHFNPVIGGKPITPIEIAERRRTPATGRRPKPGRRTRRWFFLKAAKPDRLKDAPGGAKYLTRTPRRWIAARRCSPRPARAAIPARRRSLRRASIPRAARPRAICNAGTTTGRGRKTDDYKQQMRAIVSAPDFLDGNYLSTEARVPVTLLQTNACSPLATNALAGNIWDNFSSQSYKKLPSVGTITVHDPFTGKPLPYKMPAGGRGYTRPPSLISLWSTAPFLLNNSVGRIRAGSVGRCPDARVPGVDRADAVAGEAQARPRCSATKVPGTIDRTTERSYISMPAAYVPESLRPLSGR